MIFKYPPLEKMKKKEQKSGKRFDKNEIGQENNNIKMER